MVPAFLHGFLTELQRQRERWVYWLPVPLGFGIIWYFSLKSEPPLFIGLTAFLATLTLFGAFYRNRAWLPLWLAALLLLLGFTAGQWRTHLVDAPVLQKKSYPATLQGRVVEVDPLPKAYRIVIEDIVVTGGKIWQDHLPARVRIKLKNNDPAVPRAGDIVSVKAVLLPLSGPVLPGAFDFQRYGFFRQLGATGYAIGDMTTVQRGESGFFFENLRRRIRERIAANIDNPDHAALMTAFMVGESNGISEKTWDIARLSGIAHLIAISGSHFVMIAGFPFFLIRALLAAIPFVALRFPVKKIAAVGAIAVSVFYMLLIGSPIPAQRAVLSVSIIMLAILLDRDPFTLRLAAFSAFVILLLRPESLLGASFQLSFAAIVALIAFYESTRTWWQKHFREENIFRRYSFYLIGCFMTTVVASGATAAFALYHFSSVPLLAGLVANMVAVPVTTFITFPLGLLACLLMPLGLEKGLLVVTEKSLDIVMAVAEDVTHWPHASFEVDGWPMWILGVFALGGLWLCFWQGRLRLLGILPMVAALACIPLTPRADVLVSDSARIFAVRGNDGTLWVSSARIEKFVRNEWIEREGGQGHDFWPADNRNLRCTADDSCIYARHGRKVSFVEGSAMMDDGTFIDLETTRDVGAIAIYFDAGGKAKVVTVRDVRGLRPWTSYPSLFRRGGAAAAR